MPEEEINRELINSESNALGFVTKSEGDAVVNVVAVVAYFILRLGCYT